MNYQEEVLNHQEEVLNHQEEVISFLASIVISLSEIKEILKTQKKPIEVMGLPGGKGNSAGKDGEFAKGVLQNINDRIQENSIDPLATLLPGEIRVIRQRYDEIDETRRLFLDNDLSKHKAGLIEARKSAEYPNSKAAVDYAIKIFDFLRGIKT